MRPILFAALLSWPASLAIASSEINQWSSEGDWEILARTGEDQGCFARRFFEGGTEVQIGTEPTTDGWYFAAYNASWTHLNDRTVSEVEFEFEDVIFAGNAEVRTQTGIPGGYAFFNNPAFLDEFGNKMNMRISGPKGNGIEINLSGSKKAVAAVQKCQGEQRSSGDK